MFENEIAINQLQMEQFEKIVLDLPEEGHFRPSPGHGHSPVWILGHLALTGELGQRLLGGTMTHREWSKLFGPGSVDCFEESPQLAKPILVAAVREAYRAFQERAKTADVESMQKPHSIALFNGTPIETVGQCVSLLLTNHFGFHLSQLSSCRRSLGHSALF